MMSKALRDIYVGILKYGLECTDVIGYDDGVYVITIRSLGIRFPFWNRHRVALVPND